MVLDNITRLLETEYKDKKLFNRAINILKRPQNIIKKKLIIKLSSGKKKVLQSFRIQHNDARGPYMGGIKYSPVLTEEEVKKLAFYESIKTSLVNIPFGGSFGGIITDTDKISLKDLEKITKRYSEFLALNIGVWKDILIPNTGINNQVMSWMMEAYEKKKKIHSPATFTTNKHSLDGAVFILEEYIKTSYQFSRIRKLDVAISGFGERAYLFAKNLNKQNFRIVALTDSKGGVVNSSGFDIEEIKMLKDKFTDLKEVSVMKSLEFISNEKLTELPVDVLVVGSKKSDVLKVGAKVVIELTNREFEIAGANLLPSILLNSGFNVIAHLDWVQKMHGYDWSKDEMSKKLRIIMQKTFSEVKSIVDEKKVGYRDASMYLGLKRIIDAMMERGRV